MASAAPDVAMRACSSTSASDFWRAWST